MPRRNPDRVSVTPLDIKPSQMPRPVKSFEEATAERDARFQAQRDREEAKRRKRIADALDWSTCCVPGCGADLRLYGKTLVSDPDVQIPLCFVHEVMTWRHVQRRNGDPDIIRTAEHLATEERERDARAEANRKASIDGHIYFVRLNGLVKVGWSRDVHTRLRAYGPDVEVLCYFVATRDDETNLHRQLRPYLARGREWYEDCRLIADMVNNIVKTYGRPLVHDEWTRPKPAAVGVRRSARAKPTGLSI